MKRRIFLKNLPGIGFILFEFKNAIGSVISQVFPNSSADELLVYPPGSSRSRKIPLLKRNELVYVSVFRLCEALKYRTYYNAEKRKIVIYLYQNKVLVTADNPFILIDRKIYQMPANALWINGEIYLPLAFFVPLINVYTNLRMDYTERNNTFRVFEKDYNVLGIEIEEKENGTVIHIKNSLSFKNGEITFSKRYQWYHVDLFGGKADIQRIENATKRGLVKRIKVHQFDQLLSLAFMLKSDPLSSEVYQDEFTGDVILNLRTKEELSEFQPEQSAEEETESNDIQEQLKKERERWLIDKIVIDPGHGGKDPGAIGPKKLYEKDVVLDVALKLGQIIEKNMKGVDVIYTRKDDRFISLQRRTQIANENNAKVFISIHANSSKNKRTNGFETFILGPEKGDRAKEVVLKENAVIGFEDEDTQEHYKGINMILATMAQSAFMRQSEYLASQIQDELFNKLRSLNLSSRGIKQAPFWVMVGASMPAVLVEIGFITNSYEAKVLKTASYQQKIAEGVFAGIHKFREDYENAI
jgi:N-acetylmuramoyl-L-alanine amidase